jgi:fluoride exporter
MWKTIAYIAVGSVIGGVSRFLLQQFIQRKAGSVFPYGTLLVNLLGCFIIGIVVGLAGKGSLMSAQTRIFWATGICGGFTTFSSFINESHSMLQDGEFLNTFTYIAVSIVAGLLATALGILLIKIF